MSSPAQYIEQLRESNQALTEGMVKYAETIVALRRELACAGHANTLDVMDRAYFAGKDAGIAEAAAVAAAQPEQEPVGYYCENAVGHKFYRRTKPDKVYKPIALYAAPPRKEVVKPIDSDAGALHPKYHYHPTWAIYDAIREGSMSDEQFRHWCNWTAQETLAMVQQGQSPAPPSCHGDRT